MPPDCTELGHELSTFEFWSRPASERAGTFARLRAEAPLSYHPPPEFGKVPADRWYWAVTRYDDVVAVSRNTELFSSAQGVNFENPPIELLEVLASIIVMDPPRHSAVRRVVSGAFTPRRVAVLEHAIARQAEAFADDFVECGGGDAADFAAQLPLWTVSTMLGVPESMRADVNQAVGKMSLGLDPAKVPEGMDDIGMQVEGAMTLFKLASELAAARRANPTDDLVSVLVQSELGGEPLNDTLVGSIFLLLAFAGNDTTRTSTSQALKLFADHPDQWATLRASTGELINPAIEEVLRYVSPVIQFRRTITKDVQFRGQSLAQGDWIVIFYESANRDETVFEDPMRFDVTRHPNHHVAFGGGGAHFCLGASVARTQLRALFRRLAERCAELHTEEPTYLGSNFINGIVRMPVSIVPS